MSLPLPLWIAYVLIGVAFAVVVPYIVGEARGETKGYKDGRGEGERTGYIQGYADCLLREDKKRTEEDEACDAQ